MRIFVIALFLVAVNFSCLMVAVSMPSNPLVGHGPDELKPAEMMIASKMPNSTDLENRGAPTSPQTADLIGSITSGASLLMRVIIEAPTTAASLVDVAINCHGDTDCENVEFYFVGGMRAMMFLIYAIGIVQIWRGFKVED